MPPTAPPASLAEFPARQGPIRRASRAIHAASIASLEVALRFQLACWQPVCGPGGKVRRRDLAHEESPKAHLPKNRSTMHRESTSRDRERPEKTIGCLRLFVVPRAANRDAHKSAGCRGLSPPSVPVHRSKAVELWKRVCSHVASLKVGTCSRVKRNPRLSTGLSTSHAVLTPLVKTPADAAAGFPGRTDPTECMWSILFLPLIFLMSPDQEQVREAPPRAAP